MEMTTLCWVTKFRHYFNNNRNFEAKLSTALQQYSHTIHTLSVTFDEIDSIAFPAHIQYRDTSVLFFAASSEIGNCFLTTQIDSA